MFRVAALRCRLASFPKHVTFLSAADRKLRATYLFASIAILKGENIGHSMGARRNEAREGAHGVVGLHSLLPTARMVHAAEVSIETCRGKATKEATRQAKP